MNCFKVILENPALAKSAKSATITKLPQIPAKATSYVVANTSVRSATQPSNRTKPVHFTPLRLPLDHIQQFRRRIEAYNFGQVRQQSSIAEYSPAHDEFPQIRNYQQSNSFENTGAEWRKKRSEENTIAALWFSSCLYMTVLILSPKQRQCECDRHIVCRSCQEVRETLLATFPR